MSSMLRQIFRYVKLQWLKPEPRNPIKSSKPMGHHGNLAYPSISRTVESKRAFENPIREHSEARKSRAAKTQHHNDVGKNSTRSLWRSPRPTYLQIPRPSDSPAILQAKLTAILSKLVSGQSLAAATDFLATPNPDRDPFAKATRELNENEIEALDAWMNNPNLQLQPINWTTAAKEEVPTSKIAPKKAFRRAEALNRLYHTKGLQPAHAVWYTQN
ncbi:MAG: hypothetical protein Q9221_001243 [Calogaya cf. arnoldii]